MSIWSNISMNKQFNVYMQAAERVDVVLLYHKINNKLTSNNVIFITTLA